MFGAHYFGQVVPAGAVQYLTTDVELNVIVAPLVAPSSGGGWSHRGAVTLPRRRPTGLPPLPKLPKPPYLFLTPPDADF